MDKCLVAHKLMAKYSQNYILVILENQVFYRIEVQKNLNVEAPLVTDLPFAKYKQL